ncbi:MAG TPA: BON domain-containing protein, partial [Vicinamibacteria bacterium]|nr:BON domain-containing protein [Vicinamibacteria bacterium]
DALSGVLMQALQKEPGRRFASATAMANALQGVLALPLPERPGTADAARAGSDRPPTPPSIPFDIDRHETRVMPKTPPVPGPSPYPGPSPLAARSTPPPIPQTPAPSPTMAGPAPPSWTPVPAPTVFSPPPLPGAPATVFEPPRGRGRKRRWWLWAVAAVVLLSFFNRDSNKSKRRDAQPSPPPAAGESSDLQEMHDGVIAVAVQRALRSNPRTRRADIEVDVENGVVALSGKASSVAAREAEAMVRRIDGVKDVTSSIDIEEPERPEKAERTEDPERAETPERGPGPGPGGIPVPPAPPFPRGRPSADPATVQRTLKEAHAAMKAGNATEAMAKFGAVLGMDHENEEARQGMKDATILLGENIRKMVPHSEPSPR